MSIIPFLVVASIGAALAVLTRRYPAASTLVGIIGLIAALALATTIRADDAVTLGGSAFEGSSYARLFLALGAAVGLLLVLVALASGSAGDLPAATLGLLAVTSIVLGSREPILAAVAATGGGLFGVAVTLGVPTARSVVVAIRELRALVMAGLLIIGAIAWASRFPETASAGTGVIGLAYLAGVMAVAIRFGAIPFHLWAARVADAAPETALPLVMAWGPAALAVVGMGWVQDQIVVIETDLPVERGIVVVVAILTVVLASVAASVHEDLEHIVGYGIIADTGFIVLALASFDAAVLEPARTYLITYVLAKSALAAWASAVRETFGVRRVTELGGWARRAPLLAVGLVAILVASIGLPGVAVWESRAAVSSAVLAGPLAALLFVCGLLPAMYVGRLLAVGYGRTSTTVAASSDPWPRRPDRERPRGPAAAIGWLVAAWHGNRAPIAAAIVLVVAGLSMVVAVGGLGVRDAAGAFDAIGPPSAARG